MGINTTYLDLCTQVYEISKPTAPEDALAFYKSYADEASGAILEPMCGTGLVWGLSRRSSVGAQVDGVG